MSILEGVFYTWYNTCMSIGYELTIEQSQKLSMTPELIQAIQILQFNNEELNEYIKNELLENPVLEVAQSTEKGSLNDDDSNQTHKEPNLDIDRFRETLGEANYNSDDYRQWINSDKKEDFSYERYVSFRYSLIEHLLQQLQFSKITEKQAEIGRFLIHNIDEIGYLAIPIKEVARIMASEEQEVEEVLKVIQTFDPPGVGARDLKETLTIQLKQRGKYTEPIKYILEKGMEDLAANKVSALAKATGISESQAQELVDLIKSLEPKPGRCYDSDRTIKYVIPDVVVEGTEDGYTTSIYDGGTPTLTLSSYYDKVRKEYKEDPELTKYLNERISSALWLIKSIEQRNKTILSVANAIVDYQREYFDKGEHYLKPLTLKQIAEEVGVHESTVSRTVNGKYMQTGRGVLEMRYFFTSGIKAEGGENLSSNSIKVKIKELLREENPKKPFSDQNLVDMLKEQGFDISRRTVAKYRDSMGILPSSKRKRF